MATFVLIPGGWHGGWYFHDFATALRARGHLAFAMTLAGIGERRHQLTAVNLDTHIDDIVQLLEAGDLSDVILLGHSYAGMVVTGVLDRVPQRISAAIYADAFVPGNEQSCFDLANEAHRAIFLGNAADDGISVRPPARLLDPRVTPHPLATLLQRLTLRNPPPDVKRGYLYLSAWPDTPFTATYERLRTLPEWRTFDLPVGHNVIAKAADALLEIALGFV